MNKALAHVRADITRLFVAISMQMKPIVFNFGRHT